MSASFALRALRAFLVPALVTSIAPAQQRFAPLQKGTGADAVYASPTLFLADLDGDGRRDAVTWNHELSRPVIARGLGNGNFDTETNWLLPVRSNGPAHVVGKDLDQDGDLDLVLAAVSSIPGGLQILDNSGGRFTDVSATRLPAGADEMANCAIVDVDGNATADVVGFRYGVLNVLLNSGTGSFTRLARPGITASNGAVRLLVQDLDRDGLPDLLCVEPYQTAYWRNTGGANFVNVASTYLPPGAAQFGLGWGATLGDIDGDGDADLVIPEAGSTFGSNGSAAWLNDGQGRLTTLSPNFPAQLPSPGVDAVVADFDGDADADVFVSGNARSFLLRRESNGSYTTISVDGAPSTQRLAAGDLDGDGIAEPVCTSRIGNPLVFVRNGQGSMTRLANVRHGWIAPRPTTFGRSRMERFVDLDGDGASERLMLLADEIGIQQNDGTGWFGAVRRLPLPHVLNVVYEVVDVDFDRDGDLDLLASIGAPAGTAAPFLHLYRNDGAGGFGTGPIPMVPPSSTTFAWNGMAFDADLDGDVDYVTGWNGALRVFEQDASGALVDRTSQWLPVPPAMNGPLVLCDYDGDGDEDLFLTSLQFPPAPILVLRNDRTSFTADPSYPLGTLATVYAAAGDMDGDGDDDLVAEHQDMLVTVLHDRGRTPQVLFASGSPVGYPVNNQKTVADVDLDGDLDVALANDTLYLNDGSGQLTRSQGDAREFGEKRIPDPNNPWADCVFTDLDGDGDPDLARTNGYDFWTSTNLAHQLHSPDYLRLGRAARLELYTRYSAPRAFDLAFPYVAAGSARIVLPDLGTWRLDPNTAVVLPPVFVLQPDSRATVWLDVPSSTTFLGLPLHAQAAIVHYPARIALTNATFDVVGF